MRLRVLTSLGLSSRRRSYSLIAGSIFPFATSFSAFAMTLSRWTAIVSVSPEQHHWLVHPFERSPVDGTGTVNPQGGLMPFGCVAPILPEVVHRGAGRIRRHPKSADD